MANNEYLNKNFLDSYGTKWLFDILTPNDSSLIFSSINDESIIIDNNTKIVPVWNNGNEILNTLHTASQSEPNFKDYTLTVYSYDSCSNDVKEFMIEYGHKDGYGTSYDYFTEKTETKGIYKKYSRLLEDSSSLEFDQIYALKFNKKDFQDSLYSEFFSIKLTNPITNSIYSDIINYEYFVSQSSYEIQDHTVFNLVSGSLENGIYYQNGLPIFFGKLYPKHGVVLFNPTTLDNYLNFNTNTTPDVNGKNAEKMYLSISGSIHNMNSNIYGYWSLINAKAVNSLMKFNISIPQSSFNYSTNPSFYDNAGKIKTKQFASDPVTYFTTIGFYNTKYELLAIAKFSKPFKKTFIEPYSFDVTLEIK